MSPLPRRMPLGREALLPALALAALAGGLVLRIVVGVDAGDTTWLAGLILTGAPVVWHTARGVLRGHLAADLVAMLAIVAAVLLREPVAGLIVVLMQTGGEALERHAEGRASEAVRELEAMAPTVAHRRLDGMVEDITVDAIEVGDHLLIRPGELVPCDVIVLGGHSHVDTSRLTGEPLPLRAVSGTRIVSGCMNGEGALDVRATAPARESQYARIVELVRTAQASKAPLQRLADRYAVWFTPFTILTCAVTWFASHDPLRVLAVLVVATPCPLILAAPVAIVAGINRAARRGILFRNGAALEHLATVDAAAFDKTGTLTVGKPRVDAVLPAPGFTEIEVLQLAGSVEEHAGHLLARTLVDEARGRVGRLARASNVHEEPGQGVSGVVEGREVSVGSESFIRRHHPAALAGLALPEAMLAAFVTVDGRAAGVVRYADRMRPGLPELFRDLTALGVKRILLLSGDSAVNAREVAARAGIEEVHADLLPAGKTTLIEGLLREGYRVVMLGDGTNDAPALSTATVGVALASGGGGIAAEAADAVILADDPVRLAEGIVISRRSLRLAQSSIWIGLGLSATAMVFAALGHIPPIVGAILQEVIDVAVILNALRAATGPLLPAPQGAGVVPVTEAGG